MERQWHELLVDETKYMQYVHVPLLRLLPRLIADVA